MTRISPYFVGKLEMKNIQPKLKLKHAKVIRPTTRKVFTTKVDKKTGELIREEAGTEVREYREYRETRSDIKGVITPRKIQMYRWWFRYLQLALELEKLDFTLTEHRRMPRTANKKGFDKAYNHKVVVNRDKYIGWDLDELLTTNFDKWWKGHSHLFVETPTRLTEMQQGEVAETHDYYKYFRVDTRMTTTNIIKDLRLHLEKSRRANAWTSQWIPTSEYRQEKLFNCYNGLVMWLQGKTTEEILTSGLFRASRGKEIKYEVDIGFGGTQSSNRKYHAKTKYQTSLRDKKGKNMERVQRDHFSVPVRVGVSDTKFDERGAKANLDKMRKEILSPARRLVLIAADGYFAKHPRNKKYFGK
jgi:hypothetical protein